MVILTGPASESPDPMDPMLEAVLARVGDRIVLTPFALPETREFVRDRFAETGSNGQANADVTPNFEFYAVGLIHELSSGVPETVDLLCRKSVEIAAGDDGATISTTTVKEAAHVLGLMPSLSVEEPEPPVLTCCAEDVPAGRLIVKADGESEKSIGLNGSNLLIGRDRLCDICVQDVQVSRLHGLFVRAADGLQAQTGLQSMVNQRGGWCSETKMLLRSGMFASSIQRRMLMHRAPSISTPPTLSRFCKSKRSRRSTTSAKVS
jgi:hypothetical protein